MLFGIGRDPSGVLLSFLDRGIRGPLGQNKSAAQRIVGVGAVASLALGSIGPSARRLSLLRGVLETFLELRHGDPDPFQEVIDLIGVVAAKTIAKLDVFE